MNFHIRYVFASGEQLNFGNVRTYRVLPNEPTRLYADEYVEADRLEFDEPNADPILILWVTYDTEDEPLDTAIITTDPDLTGVYVMNDKGQTCDTVYRR